MPSSPGHEPSAETGLPTYVDGYRNAPIQDPEVEGSVPVLPQAWSGPGGPISVDTVALRRAAHLAGEAGDAAQAAARGTLAAFATGACWGDDTALGTAFGTRFAGPERALGDALAELPRVLRNLSDDLLATARDYEDTEASAVDGAVALGRALRGTS